MEAQNRSISWRGTPFNLSGNEIKVGDPAPDCELVANDLSPVRLSSYQGKIRRHAPTGAERDAHENLRFFCV